MKLTLAQSAYLAFYGSSQNLPWEYDPLTSPLFRMYDLAFEQMSSEELKEVQDINSIASLCRHWFYCMTKGL